LEGFAPDLKFASTPRAKVDGRTHDLFSSHLVAKLNDVDLIRK
jgi:hypothetical protein